MSYDSIEAANAALPKCPKPLAESDGNHWWYIDHESEELKAETRIRAGGNSISCICKTCEAKMELSADAEDIPV